MTIPYGHYTLDQHRNVVQNDVTTLFQLHFNVVPTSDTRWVSWSVKYLALNARLIQCNLIKLHIYFCIPICSKFSDNPEDVKIILFT